MAYSFSSDDRTALTGVQRVSAWQLDAAMSDAVDRSLPVAERVARVRRRVKKVRSVLRLVRPSLPNYAHENVALRDVGRGLSSLRDAAAMVEVATRLWPRLRTGLGTPGAMALIDEVTARSASRHDDEALTALDEARGALIAIRGRVPGWPRGDTDFDGIQVPFRRGYAKARKKMLGLEAEPSTEALHEWRKAVKHHRNHVRLIRKMAPELATRRVADLRQLAEILGNHHDLAVVEALLSATPNATPAAAALFQREREGLLAEALTLGALAFAERPSAFGEIWRQAGLGQFPMPSGLDLAAPQ